MKEFKRKTKLCIFYSKKNTPNRKSLANRPLFPFPKFLLIFIFGLFACNSNGYANDLENRGYSLIPAPQESIITDKDINIDSSWGIYTSIDPGNIALKRIREGAIEFYGLHFEGTGTGKIILELVPVAIVGQLSAKQAKEAYRIEIGPDVIRIIGNAEAGLFYGVQSILQLLRPTSIGNFNLPEGIITDWPDLELRVIHWDTKHHQDRMETLKRYLDWAAYFKVNAVAFEIEDKYEYPSHPIIGAPGAFTKKEMNEITAYALERFIQLIPVVQAPSHMAYVLKHKEFEHLKADNDSNYHICMCDEEAMDLIFDMYQDMIDATPGVEYFFVSTDEVYYAGICGKCEREYNETNRSQTWVNFVNRVNKWMSDRNRKMLAWVEYPLLPDHIEQLPSGLIDAIMTKSRDAEWIQNEKKAGIKQLSYSSMQGAEYLFPNYFPTYYRSNHIDGRLNEASQDIPKVLDKGADLMGTFAAAWDDAGLHNETFWLGWATVTQYGWTIGKPSIEQNIADFMNAFYGYESPNMVEIYRLLEEGARFYEDLWDKKTPSKERKFSYGGSKGKKAYALSDLTLETPSLPLVENIKTEPIFNLKYAKKIQKATDLIKNNDRLINLLYYSITRVSRNRYNLEVLLSIAYLERYSMNMVLDLAKVEDYLVIAGKEENHQKAMNHMIEAHKMVGNILKEEKKMWNNLTKTWEKSRFEKCRSFNGRDFVHVMDDVKDHFADRRKGLDYMLAPFERMKMKEWKSQLGIIIKDYAKVYKVEMKGVPIERLED